MRKRQTMQDICSILDADRRQPKTAANELAFNFTTRPLWNLQQNMWYLKETTAHWWTRIQTTTRLFWPNYSCKKWASFKPTALRLAFSGPFLIDHAICVPEIRPKQQMCSLVLETGVCLLKTLRGITCHDLCQFSFFCGNFLETFIGSEALI